MIRRNALVFAALVLGLAAAPATAQSFGFSFGSHGRHQQTSFGIGAGLGHHGHYDHARRGAVHVRFGRPAQPVGYYETVAQQVWVPGVCRQVWCPPVYETVFDACGRPIRRCVREGYWHTVQEPGRYEIRYVQVWRDGCRF